MTRTTRGSDTLAGAHHAAPRSRQEIAAHYREYAAQFRDLAAGEPDRALRRRLVAIAEEYEERARRLVEP